MNRFIKIGKAAEILGVSIQTLRRWESLGKLNPDRKVSNTRYYNHDKILGLKVSDVDLTIVYARVSSHDQKEDLRRQAELLSSYCASHGWNYQVIQDLSSGMNYYKKGLKQLLELILYRNTFKIWIFGFEKASGLNDQKRPNIII